MTHQMSGGCMAAGQTAVEAARAECKQEASLQDSQLENLKSVGTIRFSSSPKSTLIDFKKNTDMS